MYCSSSRCGSRACAAGTKTAAQTAASARNAEPCFIRLRQVLEAFNHHLALASFNRQARPKDIMVHPNRFNSGDRNSRREYVFCNYRQVVRQPSNRAERNAARLPAERVSERALRRREMDDIGRYVIRLHYILRVVVGWISPARDLD